jgi:hypothetical protein
MRFLFQITLLLFGCLFASCDDHFNEKALAEHYADSLDSLTALIHSQIPVEDSATKIDKFLRDSCPELTTYILLNKRAIAVLDEPGENEEITKKYDIAFDSIKNENDFIMKHSFKKMSGTNQMRFLNLSVLYTNILTGKLMDRSGLGLSHIEVESNDSLLWKIENEK